MPKTPKTKAECLKWCEDREIEVMIERPDRNEPLCDVDNHYRVMVDIKRDGYAFMEPMEHSMLVWADIVKPDWKDIGQQLIDADYDVCDLDNCEVCGREATA